MSLTFEFYESFGFIGKEGALLYHNIVYADDYMINTKPKYLLALVENKWKLNYTKPKKWPVENEQV